MLIGRYQMIFRKWPLYTATAVLLIYTFVLMDGQKMGDLGAIMALVFLVVVLLIFILHSRLQFTFDENGIRQQLFFGRERVLYWYEVQSASLEWQFHGHGASLTWNIHSASGTVCSFFPNFYSRLQLQALAAALMEKCKTASIDYRITDMAEGKFPWYII